METQAITPNRRRRLYILLAISTISFALWLGTCSLGFVQDDVNTASNTYKYSAVFFIAILIIFPLTYFSVNKKQNGHY
jgi:heme O synthase-like polyprenyltransferase